jgi:hypothetical protein
MKPLPILLAAAVIGAGLGAALKWRSGSGSQSVSDASADADAGHRSPDSKVADATGATDDAATSQPIASTRPRPALEELRSADPGSRFSLLVRWLPGATAEEVAALAQEWFGKSTDAGTAEWDLVARRWTDMDPAAALAFGRGYTDRLLRTVSGRNTFDLGMHTPLHAVYRAWAKRDPEAALASFALEPAKYRKHLATALGDMVDESRARAWALAHPDLHEFASWRNKPSAAYRPDLSDPAKAAAEMPADADAFAPAIIVSEWVKTDPEAALAWARSLNDPKQRRHALQSAMGMLLLTDPARARPLIDDLPAGLDRVQMEARYAAALAKTDPEAAMRHATESLHGTARLEAIAGVAAEKSKTDPLAALRMLRDHGIGDIGIGGLNTIRVDGPNTSMRGNSGGGAVHDVLRAAASLDPAGVMQLLAETGTLRPGNQDGAFDRDNSLGSTLFSEWAARDSDAAARWLAQQDNSPGVTSLAQLTADRWPAQDVAGLQALATQFSPGEARNTVVAEAARRLAIVDPAGALAWAERTGGESAFSAAFRHVADSAPQAAVSLYAETLTPPQQDAQRQALTDELARHSAADAIAFFQALPPESQAGVQLTDTSRAFAREDPQAASEWIASLPPTAAKDTAISGLVDYLIFDAADPDPVAAAHWAAASIDPAGRDRNLQRVAQTWFQRNPAGSRSAIAASGLPPDIQSILLQHAPQPR